MSTDPTQALFAWEDGAPTRRAVTRCALSRICGACGTPLGRPIAFVGDAVEVARNEFHRPPLHTACAPAVLATMEGGTTVLTSGYEFVRPATDDTDRAVRFVPNSLLSAPASP